MKRIMLIITLWILSNCQLSMAFTLSSGVFESEQPIPQIYTCFGKNVSPPLYWTDAPNGTQSYVLTMSDPDTIETLGFEMVHWVLFNINGSISMLNPNASVGTRGINAKGNIAYDGPCPPAGMGQHHYIFQLYALDIRVLMLPQGATLDEVNHAMQDHILESTQLVGTYGSS